MRSTAKADRRARIPMTRLLAYCSLTFPIVAVGLPVTTYLPPLYASQGGLGLVAVGAIFMVARIWDVISDPIVGILVDRFRWRRGPRKFWIALSVPMLCVTALFLFMPARGEGASGAGLLIQLLVLYTGWTFLQTAHQAWGADLAPGYDERSRLFGAREIVNASGTIFILALPAIVSIWFSVDEYTEVAVMGWFLVLMLPLTVLLSFVLVPDKRLPTGESESRAFNVRELLASLRGHAFWRVLAIEIATGVGVGITAATFLFVTRGVVGLETGASSVLLVFFVASIAGIPIWIWLSQRFEKHTSLQMACLYSLLGNLALIPILLLGPPPISLFVVMIAVMGIGFGAPQALLRSMMGDQVDREDVRSGTNKAGFYFAFMSTAYKIGQAAAVGVSFLMLSLVGFDPENPGDPTHREGLVLVFTVAPAIVFAVCALLCRNYPLTRSEHLKDRAVLEARAGAD